MIIQTHISSVSNKRIKNIEKLQKSSERKALQRFVVEGTKETERACANGFEFEEVYFCKSIVSMSLLDLIIENNPQCLFFEVSDEVFNKIAYRESSGGVVSILKAKTLALEQIVLRENPLLLVLEGIEKPGNIGALLRTADAAGIDAVIITEGKTDIFNPNVIRASLGCVFTLPIALVDTKTALDFLKKNHVSVYVTYLNAAVGYHTVDFTKASAIVMGTEADGISRLWIENSTQNIIIPMKGQADSLNVSVSAAIVVFEAMRQRGFKQ